MTHLQIEVAAAVECVVLFDNDIGFNQYIPKCIHHPISNIWFHSEKNIGFLTILMENVIDHHNFKQHEKVNHGGVLSVSFSVCRSNKNCGYEK